MREINEYKEEIFRRSKAKLQKRQKMRQRILTWCLPIAICLAAYSAITLLPAVSSKNGASESADGIVIGNTSGSYICSYTQVTIKKGDEVKTITDKVATTRLFELVFFPDDGNDQATSDESKKETGSLLDTPNYSSHAADYVITFQTDSGAQSIFLLNGNELYNVSRETKTILTDTQLTELLAALGVSG